MGGEGGGSQLIKPINKAVVHRICSGQVIFDLSSAVKELVENSLDAGATSIEINLKDYGEEYFKVIDNGCGISPQNFQALALKHHTSKISDFSDLHSLTTFGFRGEALSSLCSLGNLTVETRTKNEPLGTHLIFDHSGLVTGERKIARQVGTTVTVGKLFSTLPVRSKEFSRNIRREYGKLVSLLNAYALIAKGVRFLCTNSTGKNAKSAVVKTQGSASLKDNIITVFGISTFTCLEPLNFSISEDFRVEGFLSKPRYGSGRTLGDRQYFFINGRPVDMPKVSKLVNELFRYSNSKQFPIAILNFTVPTTACDVNVSPDKRKIFFSDEGTLMLSLRAEIGKIYCPNECSFSVNIMKEPEKGTCTLPSDASDDENILTSSKELSHRDCDYNRGFNKFDPSKMLQVKEVDEEKKILPCEKNSMQRDLNISPFEVKEPGTCSVYHLKHSSDFGKTTSKIDENTTTHVRPERNGNAAHVNLVQSSLTRFVSPKKRKYENSCSILSEVPLLRNESSCQNRKISSDMHYSVSEPYQCLPENDVPEANARELPPDQLPPDTSNTKEISSTNESDFHENNEQDLGITFLHASPAHKSVCSDKDVKASLTPSSKSFDERCDTLKPCSGSKSYSTLQFSMDDLRRKAQLKFMKLHSSKPLHHQMRTSRLYTAATVENSQPVDNEGKAQLMDAATSELDRFFKKEYFGQMQVVIGQFNLGFIVGKIEQDLFIIDQHAADEKYNFERLSQSTILNLQPLLKPMRLELSPEEEIVTSIHMQIIRKNGFALIEDMQAPPGHRFLLKAVPFSKNIIFGAEDVKELISILSDSQGESGVMGCYKMDTSDSICPSRVRAMLASRACRTSVMIGDPLTKSEMQKILRNLVDLNSPWNCPHELKMAIEMMEWSITFVPPPTADPCGLLSFTKRAAPQRWSK
ncbi:DNA mismatch repair protein PMS1 isoform X1 [Canna indica]|uniref:DNA mismatch repair protein PMS1 isoform X1 n=1 Tax=Canna indica TaxID=4628 RepID=A0AAQ3QL89_9LILI|nr:DNA mismatch repair protein PMS1 isoform X1 [Canna indica]